jgi:hypothetical protein
LEHVLEAAAESERRIADILERLEQRRSANVGSLLDRIARTWWLPAIRKNSS